MEDIWYATPPPMVVMTPRLTNTALDDSDILNCLSLPSAGENSISGL